MVLTQKVLLFFVLLFLLPKVTSSPVVSHPDRITEVKTNIYVTSFGPVSDTDMVRGHTEHVFSVFNYSPSSSHWRFPPVGKVTSSFTPESCFFCFIFSFVAASPPFIIASSSLSLSLSHTHSVLKWGEFSTRQHCLYSSDNFHLINYLKCPLVIRVTPLFILASPVYHSEACAHLHITS